MNGTFQNVKLLVMPGPRETLRLDTERLRASFLVDDLFASGEIRLVITDMDRLAQGAAVPVEPLPLSACPAFGTNYFTERRELGVVNLGQTGHVRVGGKQYPLQQLDFLYIGAGNEEIWFETCGSSRPAFYFLSCPAHRALPVKLIGRHEVQPEMIGQSLFASRRRLSKYIHADGAASCQLVMGLTELEPGSV